jgi:hypothetical protein
LCFSFIWFGHRNNIWWRVQTLKFLWNITLLCVCPLSSVVFPTREQVRSWWTRVCFWSAELSYSTLQNQPDLFSFLTKSLQINILLCFLSSHRTPGSIDVLLCLSSTCFWNR